jgi:hypothetical protein
MTAGGHFRTAIPLGVAEEFQALEVAFVFSKPLALPFDVRDESSPAFRRGLARWECNHNQLNWALAPNGVAVLDSSRTIHEASFAHIERLTSTTESQLALQNIKDFIFRWMRMIRRFLSFAGRVFRKSSSTAGVSSPALIHEGNAVPVDTAFAGFKSVWRIWSWGADFHILRCS